MINLYPLRIFPGFLTNGYGSFVPLKGMYNLYLCLGETCTVRDFLCAMRRPLHCTEIPQPPLRDNDVLLGRNAYVFGDEITFIGSMFPIRLLVLYRAKLYRSFEKKTLLIIIIVEILCMKMSDVV